MGTSTAITAGASGRACLCTKRRCVRPAGEDDVLEGRTPRALAQRDGRYRLEGVIELDGADFARVATEKEPGDARVLVAVESKEWIDERGGPKGRAGFAQVEVAHASKIYAQGFVDRSIRRGAMVNTDAGGAFIGVTGVDVDYQVVKQNKRVLDRWLPWVHKFISNSKIWLLGTHHAVSAKYLRNDMAETTFRFNRRHAPSSLFHRALAACARATPIRPPALCA